MPFGSAPASVSRKPPAVSVTILAKLSNFSAIADAPRKKNAAPARQPVLHAGQTPAERFPDNAIPATSETPAERFSETAETERTRASPARVLRHGRGNGSAQNSRRLLLRRIVLAATRQQTVLDRSHRRTPLEKDREVLRIVVLEAERNLLIGRDVVVSSLLASLSFSSCMYWAGDVPVNSLNAFRNPE